MKRNPVRTGSVMGEMGRHNKDAVVRPWGVGLKTVEIVVGGDRKDRCLIQVKDFLHRLFSTGDSGTEAKTRLF